MRSRLATAGLFVVAAVSGCSGAGDAGALAADPDMAYVIGVVVTEAIVPLAGATVSVASLDKSTKSDGNGSFVLGPLEPGAYVLQTRADGFAAGMSRVQLAVGENSVNVVMVATSTAVPYIEVQQFAAFIECSYAQSIGGNFGCLGVVGLVTGIEVDRDQDHFQFDVAGNNFKGLLAEMVWKPQSTGPYYSAYIRNVVEVGQAGGLGLEQQFWSAVNATPLRGWVLQGVENDGAYDGDVFHPDANATGRYEYSIAGMSDTSKPVDVAVTINQSLDVFLTKFYNALGSPDYTMLD